jgi:acyl-CoA synthetase (AMP-forming)/AMP-acid ligase II
MITDKPGSVGVPVAGSLAIVDSNSLKPLPFGKEGEIAISGSTVINNYLNNGEADRKSYFQLTLPVRCNTAVARNRFFLTGDVGVLDKDGFLSLKGRNKELIKKGGEQISPFEIEEPLLDHPWVEIAICFAVPSQLYGEEAGIAIVLSANSPADATLERMIKELRVFLQKKDVSPLKWPTKWKIVEDEELPKTKTKKYIRVGKFLCAIRGEVDLLY